MKLFIFSFLFSFFSLGAWADPTLLIFGPDEEGYATLGYEAMKKSCERDDCLIIDARKGGKTISDLQVEIDEFRKKLDVSEKSITVLLYAHGNVAGENDNLSVIPIKKGEHTINLVDRTIPSSLIFKMLGNRFEEVNVFLASCFSGACDVSGLEYLPANSRIFTTSGADEFTAGHSVMSFFRGFQNDISSLDYEELVIRYFLDGTYILLESPNLLKANGKRYSVVEALAGKIGLPFSESEKERVITKLKNFIDSDTIKQIISKIETGGFDFYDDHINLRLAVMYALSENFEFEPELVARGKRNLELFSLPFLDATKYITNTLLYISYRQHLSNGKFTNVFIFANGEKSNEYYGVYRIDGPTKHSYSYKFVNVVGDLNDWIIDLYGETLNFSFTSDLTKSYKLLNRIVNKELCDSLYEKLIKK